MSRRPRQVERHAPSPAGGLVIRIAPDGVVRVDVDGITDDDVARLVCRTVAVLARPLGVAVAELVGVASRPGVAAAQIAVLVETILSTTSPEATG